MIEIRKYCRDDLESVVAVFRSNIPTYFSPNEEPELYYHLDHHAENYYVVMDNSVLVGAGGIAFNDTEPPTVSLCWGMVHRDRLGQGLGKKLTEFRVALAREIYGDLPLTLGTSQHTEGFYEKFGFCTVERTIDGSARESINVECGLRTKNGRLKRCELSYHFEYNAGCCQ